MKRNKAERAGAAKGKHMKEKPLKVLLIEDNKDDLSLTREVFRRARSAPMRLAAAASLKEALTILKSEHYDAIVADLNLPDSRGQETFEAVRAAAPATPLLLLTVLNDEDLAIRLVKLGAQDYIVKGDLSPALLVRAVYYAIERNALSRMQTELIAGLEKALAEVKTLSGLLPMCAKCKKIRNAKGEWQGVEDYISKRTDAEFTHGMCPECTRELYPEFAEDKDDK